jgi:antitoxin component of MazEF toxin-antitoxin module
MTTKANRWGAALGIRLTNPVLEKFPIDEKTLLDLDVQEDRIIITRAKIQPKITLEELFADFDGEYELDDEDSAWLNKKPAGREVL